MDKISGYNVFQIVDELTISPLIRNSGNPGSETGVFALRRIPGDFLLGFCIAEDFRKLSILFRFISFFSNELDTLWIKLLGIIKIR